MRVIDTHAHFWDVGALEYPWIEKGSLFDRSFGLDDYRRASAGASIEGMIFVEADPHRRCSLREAQWAQQLAGIDSRIQGIVARVSLTQNDALHTDLEAATAIPLVKGIRDNIQDHPAGFAISSEFVRGVKEVHRRGLHFELCLRHHQLAETLDLVKRCPDGSFVLDHCAKPSIREGEREPWATLIREMAGLPNVVCKISGLVTEADWFGWTPEQVLWYAREAAKAFGPDRIMFGSDWPVNEAAGGYMKWFRVAEALSTPWTADERARFFFRNAERIYRLRPV